MEKVLSFLERLLQVCITFYTTSISCDYSIDYSMPLNITSFYSNKVNELQNFSSIFTGILSSYSMVASFEAAQDSSLGIVNVTQEIMNPQNGKLFMYYEKDFYQYFLSKNQNKFLSCESYFQNCSTMNQTSLSSSLDNQNNLKNEYFILNKMLSPATPIKKTLVQSNTKLGEDTSTQLSYKITSTMNLSHLRVGNSFYYVILGLTSVQIIVLIYNIVLLTVKRNRLKEKTKKLKSN